MKCVVIVIKARSASRNRVCSGPLIHEKCNPSARNSIRLMIAQV